MIKTLYWNTDKNNIEAAILAEEAVVGVIIAVAYLSEYGVSFVERLAKRHQLAKDSIRLYIARDFSLKNPSRLLSRLVHLCQVRIVNLDRNLRFHSKLFFLERDEAPVCFVGSSNCTKGGLVDNIEFVHKFTPTGEQINEVRWFEQSLTYNSQALTDDIISNYAAVEDSLHLLQIERNSYSDIFGQISSMSDPVIPKSLPGQYFDYADYECLFRRNSFRTDVPHRIVLQGKLLDLNRDVKV